MPSKDQKVKANDDGVRDFKDFDYLDSKDQPGNWIADLHYSSDERGIIMALIQKCKADPSGPLPDDWANTVAAVLRSLKEAPKHGALASVALAQAIHESGWFRKDVYFGIKARASDVAGGRAIASPTKEFFDDKTIAEFVAAGKRCEPTGKTDKNGLKEVVIDDFFFMEKTPKAQFDRYWGLLERVHPQRLGFLPTPAGTKDGVRYPAKGSDPLGFLRYICRPGHAYSTTATYPEDVWHDHIVPLQLWQIDSPPVAS